MLMDARSPLGSFIRAMKSQRPPADNRHSASLAPPSERPALVKTSGIHGFAERGGEFQTAFNFLGGVRKHPVVES